MTALRDALIGLDPADDTQWTKAGLPALNHLEGVTGETVTRAAVDALLPNDANRENWAGVLDALASIDAAADDDPNASSEPASYDPVVGAVVQVTTAEPHDGAYTSAAIVVKVNDDGSVNLRIFSANGGADGFLSGVQHSEAFDAEDAQAPYWDWPY